MEILVRSYRRHITKVHAPQKGRTRRSANLQGTVFIRSRQRFSEAKRVLQRALDVFKAAPERARIIAVARELGLME